MLMQNFGVTNKEHYGMLWYFQLPIRHFGNERGTGTETRPTIVSGFVTQDAPVSYWPNFFPRP